MKRMVVILWSLLVVVTAARGEDRVVLENVRTEWQNAYGAIIYTVLADVKNVSSSPVQFAKVKVALSDKNGQLVAERVGYNVGAEVLDSEVAGGTTAERLQRIRPIAPGATDLVRMSLDKSDIGKPFRRTSVTLVEAR